MDNLSANKTPPIRAWAKKNKVQLCFTPTSASWADPKSFSPSSRRKSSRPATSPAWMTLSGRLLTFVDRNNQTARPFNWRFTASDLTALLRRISEREQPAEPAVLPQAA
jgi:hypothetical protein